MSCGGGVQRRERLCNNPEPEHGGADCKGPETSAKNCNRFECRLSIHLYFYLLFSYIKVLLMEAGLLGVPGSALVVARAGSTSFQHAPLIGQEPAQILLLLTMETIALDIVMIFIIGNLRVLFL